MVINDRIASLISELNTNPSSFADSIGVKSAVIYNIIKGRRNKPSYDVLKNILEVYGTINSEWLLKGEGNIWHEQELDGVDIESRMTVLLNRIKMQSEGDLMVEELTELCSALIRENNHHKNLVVRLYEKNEKLMDVLRNKLDLDI